MPKEKKHTFKKYTFGIFFDPSVKKLVNEIKLKNPTISGISTNGSTEISNIGVILARNVIEKAMVLIRSNDGKMVNPLAIMLACKMVVPKLMRGDVEDACQDALDKYKKNVNIGNKTRRSDLVYSVSRTRYLIRKQIGPWKVQLLAAVVLAAFIEWATRLILEPAAQITISKKKKRINDRHILLAVRQDENLDKLLKNMILGGGFVPPQY